jgi:hypothetical protein
MATGLIHTNDPCFSWTDSVVEAVSETTNRLVRWRGIDLVEKPVGWTPRDPMDDLRQLSSPLFLPEDHAETIRDAHARSQAGLPARDRTKLVRATACMTAQAAGLSSPEPDNIGELWEPEASLDTGLAEDRIRGVPPRRTPAGLHLRRPGSGGRGGRPCAADRGRPSAGWSAGKPRGLRRALGLDALGETRPALAGGDVAASGYGRTVGGRALASGRRSPS